MMGRKLRASGIVIFCYINLKADKRGSRETKLTFLALLAVFSPKNIPMAF